MTRIDDYTCQISPGVIQLAHDTVARLALLKSKEGVVELGSLWNLLFTVPLEQVIDVFRSQCIGKGEGGWSLGFR